MEPQSKSHCWIEATWPLLHHLADHILTIRGNMTCTHFPSISRSFALWKNPRPILRLFFFPMEKLQVPALKYLVILFNPSSKIEDPFLPFPPHWSTQWRPTRQLRLSPYATLAATVRSKREGSWSTTPRHRRKSYAKNIRSKSDTRQIRPYLESYNTPKKIEKWFTSILAGF